MKEKEQTMREKDYGESAPDSVEIPEDSQYQHEPGNTMKEFRWG